MNDEVFFMGNFLKKITDLFPAPKKGAAPQPDLVFQTKTESYIQFFKELTCLSPSKVCEFLIPKIEESVKVQTTSSTQEQQFRLISTLINLLKVSVDSYKGGDDILSKSQHSSLISIASILYSNESPQLQPIKKQYLILMRTCSNKSPHQIISFLFNLEAQLRGNLPVKKLEYAFDIVCHSITDIDKLEQFISALFSLNCSSQYYPLVFDSIPRAFISAISKNPDAYSQYLDENGDNTNAAAFSEKIIKWGTTEQTISARTVLYLLQPQKMAWSFFGNSELFDYFRNLNICKETSQCHFLKAILIPYIAVSSACTSHVLYSFVEPIQDFIMEFLRQNISKNLQLPAETYQSLLVDFPVGFLLSSPTKFSYIFMELFKNEEDEDKIPLAEIISKVLHITKRNPDSYQLIYNELFGPLNIFIMKIDVNNPPKSSLGNLMTNGFKEDPYFFRRFIFENQQSFQRLLEISLNGGYDFSALFGIYNERFLKYPLDLPFWNSTRNITGLLSTVYEKKIAKNDAISSFFTNFATRIVDFLRRAFSLQQFTDFPNDALTSIIYDLETISYVTLTINKQWAKLSIRNLLKQIFFVIQNLKVNVETPKISISSFCKAFQKNSTEHTKKFALAFKNYYLDNSLTSKTPQAFLRATNILMPRLDNLSNSVIKLFTNSAPNAISNQNCPNLDNLISCIYIIFSLTRKPTQHFVEILSSLICDNEKVAFAVREAIADSLSPPLYLTVFSLIDQKFNNNINNNNNTIVNNNNIVSNINNNSANYNSSLIGINNVISSVNNTCLATTENSTNSQLSIENMLFIMTYLLDSDLWDPDPNFASILSNLLKNFVLFCIFLQKLIHPCVRFIISLFRLADKQGIQIEPNVCHFTGKTIINWINQLTLPDDKPLGIMCFKALYSVLNGFNFSECADTKPNAAEAFENFLLYFSQIKDTINDPVKSGAYFEAALSLLTPIMKNNFDMCINHTISLAFDNRVKTRSAFLLALSTAITPESYKKFLNPVIKVTIIDLIFEDNFNVVKLLAEETPYSLAGETGACIIEASALKGNEIEIFETLAKFEMDNNDDPTRNTLFRGNALTSRALSYFPKFFAGKWAEELVKPLIHFPNNDMKVFWAAMISRIEDMFTIMPRRMIKAIQILYKLLVVESKEIALSMLSGFVFLRFLCPIIAKIEGLVDASSLLMNASIRPTVSENRPQFMYMKDEVAEAHRIIIDLFMKIVSQQPTMDSTTSLTNSLTTTTATTTTANLRVDSITTQFDPILDQEKITTNLCSSLWDQISVIEKKLRDTAEEVELHSALDKLITKLRKMGKPPRIAQKNTHMNFATFETPLDDLLQMPPEPLLENWFSLAPREAKDGSVVFIMSMSEIKQPFTAQQLCSHIFSQVLSIGESKYSVVVEFADFDVDLLPSIKLLKKFIKLATDEMYSRLLKVYITRVQNNALNYLTKGSVLLKSLPLVFVTNLKSIIEEVGDIPLSEATHEFYSQEESSFAITCKLNDHSTIRLHQRSIQIIGKGEINSQSFNTADVILLSSIESIGHSTTTKSTSSFIIRTKSGHSYTIQSLVSLNLHNSVTKLFQRFKVAKIEKNILFVDRSSLHSLLIILSFINMLSDRSDQDLRVTALNLFRKVVDASGLIISVDMKHISAYEVPFSMLQTVEVLADDLAKSNPNEVHNILHEFSKSIAFLNPKDYANSERFIQPWIHYASEQAISNATTLDYLAQIATKAPKKCFMQFNKNIWQNFNRMDLLNTLLSKLCVFDESSFASIFLSIAVNFSSEVTKFIISKLFEFATDQTQRQFSQLADILNSLIVGKLFDDSCKIQLLYSLSIIRLIGIRNVSHSAFLIFKALSNDITQDESLFSSSKSFEVFMSSNSIGAISSDILNQPQPPSPLSYSANAASTAALNVNQLQGQRSQTLIMSHQNPLINVNSKNNINNINNNNSSNNNNNNSNNRTMSMIKPGSSANSSEFDAKNFLQSANYYDPDYRQFLLNTAKLADLYHEFNFNELIPLYYKDATYDKNLNNNENADGDNYCGTNLDKENGFLEKVKKVNGIIFYTILEEKNSTKFIFDVLKESTENCDLRILSATLTALSATSIPRPILAPLFFSSIAVLLHSKLLITFDLILNILTRVKSIENDLRGNISSEFIADFDKITGLPFSTRPLYSFLLILWAFYIKFKFDINPILSILNQNGENDNLLTLLRFQNDPSLESSCKSMDFGKDFGDFTAVVIALFSVQPSEHIKRLLFKITEENPNYFTKSIDFVAYLVKGAAQVKMDEPKLLLEIVKAMKKSETNYEHIKIVDSLFKDKPLAKVELSDIKELSSGIFKNYEFV